MKKKGVRCPRCAMRFQEKTDRPRGMANMWHGDQGGCFRVPSFDHNRRLTLRILGNTKRHSAGNLGFDCATTFRGFDHSSGKATHAYPVVSASPNMLWSALAWRIGNLRLRRISLWAVDLCPVPSPSKVRNAVIGCLRRLWRKTNSAGKAWS